MKKFLIICLILFGTILPSFAVNWIEWFREGSFLDTDSFVPYVNNAGYEVPDQFSYRIKIINEDNRFDNYEKKFNKKIEYVICIHIIDIKRKVSALKQVTIYGVGGKQIICYDYNGTEMEWDNVEPRSIEGVFCEALRKRYYQNEK